MFQLTNPNAVGIIRFQHKWDVMPSTLVERFGYPQVTDGDKTSMEWYFSDNDDPKRCVAIWDYYEAAQGNTDSDDIISFSVSASDQEIAHKFIQWANDDGELKVLPTDMNVGDTVYLMNYDYEDYGRIIDINNESVKVKMSEHEYEILWSEADVTRQGNMFTIDCT
jgi:hypothetical protein